MKRDRGIPEVAILLNTASQWGRLIVKGILAYANEHGPWHVWVKVDTPQKLDHLPENLNADGIIARVVTPTLAQELTEYGKPVVNVSDCQLDNYSAPCVRTDDEVAIQLALEHFQERGLRHLAFVGPRHNPNPIWYGKTFAKKALAAGLTFAAYTLTRKTPDYTERLGAWLQSLPKPAGILVWGQGNGRTVVDVCLRNRIPVPHDIAILCGSYDEIFAHACFPTLSGILLPTEQIGYKAAEKLAAMMQGHPVPNDTTFLPPHGIKECLSTDTVAVEDPQLAQVIQFIREHAFEPITMRDILKEIPMARRSLERKFGRTFGHSPSDEIRRLRIHRARQLLIETDWPMQQIAESCGYATYNYMTRVFSSQTGMSPKKYRNAHSRY